MIFFFNQFDFKWYDIVFRHGIVDLIDISISKYRFDMVMG